MDKGDVALIPQRSLQICAATLGSDATTCPVSAATMRPAPTGGGACNI